MSHELLKRVTATFVDCDIDLGALEDAVERNFARHKQANPALWNGSTLMYPEVLVHTDEYGNKDLTCMRAPYALYMYLNDNPQTRHYYRARIIAPVTIVSTTDEFYAFGVMAEHTLLAGIVLAAGGSCTFDDVENHEVMIQKCATRELFEELPLTTVDISPLQPVSWFSSSLRFASGPVYHSQLHIDKKELQERFDEKCALEKNTLEFSSLVFVGKDPNEVRAFAQRNDVIDYLPGALTILQS